MRAGRSGVASGQQQRQAGHDDFSIFCDTRRVVSNKNRGSKEQLQRASVYSSESSNKLQSKPTATMMMMKTSRHGDDHESHAAASAHQGRVFGGAIFTKAAAMSHLKHKFSTINCLFLAALTLSCVFLACSAASPAQQSIELEQQQQQRQRESLTANYGSRFKRQSDETSPPPTTTTSSDQANESTPAATTTVSAAAAASAAPTHPTDKPKSKIPPVNFTQVDEHFDAVFDDSEVLSKWRRMDKQMTDGVRAILKLVFPHVVSMASDAKVSGSCSGAILKWILNLRNMRTWAVKMLDAIGKPSAGLLEGSLTLFGNYRECLQVRAPDEDEIEVVNEFREYFRGQYCVLHLKPFLPKKPQFYSLNSTIQGLLRKSYKYYEKGLYDDLSELAMAFNFVDIRADLCVPSLCSRDDIQRVATFLANKTDMRAKVQRCDVEPMDHLSLIDESHLLWTLLVIIILLLVLISTLTSMIFRLKKRRNKSKAQSLFTSMSVYRSLSHMMNVQIDRINDTKPVFLYTLKLILVLWCLLVALISQLDFQYLRDLLSLRDVIMLWPLQLIVNSSLQFDALILLTAFTYSYQNINSNLKDLVKYNISKYSRLMPSIMLFVALTIITPLLYLNKSPVWHDFVDEPAQVCKSNGAINLFFLQNLLNYNQICLPQTWLFCVELQLCILTIPIVYLLNKNFDQNNGHFRLLSVPIVGLILITIVGCVINFVNIYHHSLPAAWFQTFPDKDDKNLYFSQHLYKTWTHLTPFAVGLFAGHLCRCQAIETFSGRPYGKRCCYSVMCFTSLGIMATLIYSLHSWSLSGQSHLEAPILSALYAALAPLFWSISWSLILFYLTVPSEKNQHSSITNYLAKDVGLVRLGRLSFLAFLIFPYVNSFILAVQETAIFSSILMLGHIFIGNLVITFALAFVVSALVELPCRRLIKKLALGSRRQSSNLEIVSRQMNVGQQNQGRAQHLQHQHRNQHNNLRNNASSSSSNKQQQQPMIPLK